MTEPSSTDLARAALAEHCPEPIEVVLLVHPTGRRKKVFGRKELASRLHINNYLVLTSTHVRLYALGGRSGIKVKGELGAWPRNEVSVRVEEADRSSYMASTGSSLNWRASCLHLSGPGLDLAVDVRADGGLFTDDADFMDQEDPGPEVQEVIDGFREEAEATAEALRSFVEELSAS